eukprot:TRINITY_DN22840_c0_g1_i1.p1 TRINITY_DN22840_c0_g1~~TRINITY_DN22840_c0_g1_i1.p1  ORF type:complete len:589 (-),score=146.60 TRINITY_DN22840_c0_g1_i1:35-1801(-)
MLPQVRDASSASSFAAAFAPLSSSSSAADGFAALSGREEEDEAGIVACAPATLTAVAWRGRGPLARRQQHRHRFGLRERTRHVPCSLQPLWLGPGAAPVPAVCVAAGSCVVPLEEHGAVDRGLAEVARLEQEASTHEARGAYADAADALGCSLEVRRTALADRGPGEFAEAAERYIAHCNRWSTLCLERGQLQLSLELLKRADTALEAVPSQYSKHKAELRMVTLHGVCELYKTRGKLRAALQAGDRASKVAARSADVPRRAILELDAAALLQLEGSHREAASRLESLREFLLKEDQKPSCPADQDARSVDAAKRRRELVVLLLVLDCNLWLSLHNLGKTRNAAEVLRRASHVAETRLPSEHGLTRRLRDFLANARRLSADAAAPPLSAAGEQSSVSIGASSVGGLGGGASALSREASRTGPFLPPAASTFAGYDVGDRITWRSGNTPQKRERPKRPFDTSLTPRAVGGPSSWPPLPPPRAPELPSSKENVYGRLARKPNRSLCARLLDLHPLPATTSATADAVADAAVRSAEGVASAGAGAGAAAAAAAKPDGEAGGAAAEVPGASTTVAEPPAAAAMVDSGTFPEQ